MLRQIFELSIQRGWMRGVNPVVKNLVTTEVSTRKHHKSIGWEQVPNFLEDVNRNACHGTPEVDLAVKFLLMTFLRVGAYLNGIGMTRRPIAG